MDAKVEQYHQRCYELALKGLGNVAPNPMVGAVIVYNEKIIGEGFHTKFGAPHAEVEAINSVKDKELLKKSTLYVNLEPCSHTGKTPPCADLIVQSKIPNVSIGNLDPFEKVSGRGIARLKASGVNVSVGNNNDQYRFLNRRFFTFHEKKRPYIILKWAETADGFIDIVRNAAYPIGPNWITDKSTRTLVHKWRTEEQAIFIGTNTALTDNPQLSARDWYGKNPTRLCLDRNLRLPASLHIFDGSIPTFIFAEKKIKPLTNTNYVESNFNDAINEVLNFCIKQNYISIFVEGGAKLLNSFISQGAWDEARVFTGQTRFGKGILAPKLRLVPNQTDILSNTTLNIYYNNLNFGL